MRSDSESLAYAIVEQPPHEAQRWAVICEHADGFRHPIRRFRHKLDADRYRELMLRKHLHGYEFNSIWTNSQLVLCTVRPVTVITCFK